VDSPPTPRPNDQRNFAASQNGFQWAVQGNTIPACFWCVFYLLQNPAELKRVKDEIRTVMEAAKKEDPTPRSKWDIRCSRETLKKLTLLDCAIQETLRLATGSMMMRRSTKDQVLDLPTGPLPLKKGDNVAIYPYLQHHDPLLFPEPEAFQLDRWKEKPVDSSAITNVKGEKLTAAFLPFGSGISMCPGRHFARNEIKTFLVGFFSLFDLDEERQKAVENPGFLLSRAGLGIFPPSKDVEVTITHKNQK
jgi:cholesterol 7alpha-monooxygenase